MNEKTALVLLDPRDQDAGAVRSLHLPGFDRLIVREVNFEHLEEETEAIVQLAKAESVQFTFYGRNDQVYSRPALGPLIRRLQTGYSSFSGIDTDEAPAQAQQLSADLAHIPAVLPLPAQTNLIALTPSAQHDTFTLVFDTEQLGGVRFGLPRILPLLDEYGVKATFFATGFVQHIYPDLLPALVERGHEIGIHGAYHEPLAGLAYREQYAHLEDHLAEFRKFFPVTGANFIFRADADTLRALAALGIQYCVTFAQHVYRPFAYLRPSTQPLRLRTREGSLWLVPIPVETYNTPWFATRLIVDSALMRARSTAKESAGHITILMHPFRDGNRRHLPDLEALLRYLIEIRGLQPITLASWLGKPPVSASDACIAADIVRIDQSSPEMRKREGWSDSTPYYARIAALYAGLEQLGRIPALTTDCREADFAIAPDVLPDSVLLALDPLADTVGLQRALRNRSPGAHYQFVPKAGLAGWMQKFAQAVPRRWPDIAGLPSELLIRLVYRLKRHSNPF